MCHLPLDNFISGHQFPPCKSDLPAKFKNLIKLSTACLNEAPFFNMRFSLFKGKNEQKINFLQVKTFFEILAKKLTSLSFYCKSAVFAQLYTIISIYHFYSHVFDLNRQGGVSRVDTAPLTHAAPKKHCGLNDGMSHKADVGSLPLYFSLSELYISSRSNRYLFIAVSLRIIGYSLLATHSRPQSATFASGYTPPRAEYHESASSLV